MLIDKNRATQVAVSYELLGNNSSDKNKDTLSGTRTDFWMINPDNPFSDADMQLLEQVLFSARRKSDGEQPLIGTQDDNSYYVVPLRSVSPKSSKAMNILRTIFPQLKDWHKPLIELGYRYEFAGDSQQHDRSIIAGLICDRMTEQLILPAAAKEYFSYLQDAEYQQHPSDRIGQIDMSDSAKLAAENLAQGWAISDDELAYLQQTYKDLGRQYATDAELFLFAQLNSEHCRHKIFNGIIQESINGSGASGDATPNTLFGMIKHTSRNPANDLVSAYSDNAAIFATRTTPFLAAAANNEYTIQDDTRHLIFKAETHNHPTFVSPAPGAATGTGGEIRDEVACGMGGRTKAGFVGFSVSDLLLDGDTPSGLAITPRDWEEDLGLPAGKASAKQIMQEAPLGSSNYANEFGRPTLGGYFRTLSCHKDGINYGYHKPIMLAGGWGDISKEQAIKPEKLAAGYYIIVMGDPALKIGIGGGAMSSSQSKNASGKSTEAEVGLDFASVQRDNAELERRGVEAIMAAAKLGPENPIAFIHDLGAGGLGNAVAELLKDIQCGGKCVLDNIPIGDRSMSPSEIWSNESQERFVLAVAPERIPLFDKICARENAPYSVIGLTDASDKLQLRAYGEEIEAAEIGAVYESDKPFTDIVNLPLQALFPKSDKIIQLDDIASSSKSSAKQARASSGLDSKHNITDYAKAVLMLPAVANKQFLITIGDRFVGGLTAREQMAGPWQMPVNDYAATLESLVGFSGEASAIGERTPLAILDAKAAARMSLAEVVSNLAASGIDKLSDITLCANWMAASDRDGEMTKLYDAVKTTTLEMCEALNLCIPVGKDSLFMAASWDKQAVVSPVSLILSGIAPVQDLRLGVDPVLKSDTYKNSAPLWLITPHKSANRLGGSAFAQVTKQWEGNMPTPDLDNPQQLANFFGFVSDAVKQQKLLAYHDISDGGLWACVCEMAFAANCGLGLDLSELMQFAEQDAYTALFGEELGAVIQITKEDEELIQQLAAKHALQAYRLGDVAEDQQISIQGLPQNINCSMAELRQLWSWTSNSMRRLRENPDCVEQEIKLINSADDGEAAISYSGIAEKLSKEFKPQEKQAAVAKLNNWRPKVAILRSQGVNSHLETAFAFQQAGFTPVDVHINDLLSGRIKDLNQYHGAVFCGGFTYGDVMGAGVGWASSILHNPNIKAMFKQFFHREDSFSLGICNGCQVMARLQEIIPGANWECDFIKNESRIFESRSVMMKVMQSPSIFFKDMEHSIIPIIVAHGEGRATFRNLAAARNQVTGQAKGQIKGQAKDGMISMIYTDAHGNEDVGYPLNPNGSDLSAASLTSADGRATILMPHPERTLRRINQCWHANNAESHPYRSSDNQETPWQAIFYNARLWLADKCGK